jgi:hypothetical protein
MATEALDELALERLRTLPLSWLSPSALVDFLLLLLNEKPAVRLRIDSKSDMDYLRVWCRQSGFDLAADEDCFACITVEAGFASKVLELDRRTDAHEIELGLALGYPFCCCERVASIGESNIDSYAQEVARWPFAGQYRRINPSGYQSGLALISHLPCSPDCAPSLAIADRAREFVINHASEPILSSLRCSPLVSEEHGRTSAPL